MRGIEEQVLLEVDSHSFDKIMKWTGKEDLALSAHPISLVLCIWVSETVYIVHKTEYKISCLHTNS